MAADASGVLLVDWENLAGAVISRGKMVERGLVDDLWAFSHRKCGGQLQYAHMAAAKFDGTVMAAMREHLIEPNIVRSTKEQADIQLTVLAMDYLHQGCSKFVLVTGDQDFIPLIKRLHRDGCSVTVIYGDQTRLSAELRQILTTPGLESIDISAITTLHDRKRDVGCRSLLGLLELQRRGAILGGKDHAGRTALLARWGVLENEDESQYWALIESIGEKVLRNDSAARVNDLWLPRNAVRTYIDLSSGRFADVQAIDHAIRHLSARPKGLTIAALRTGPFQTNDGSKLDRVLDALTAVELVRKGADGAFAVTTGALGIGYLEPLWRIHAAISAECYYRQVRTLPYGQLAPLLNRRGIGQGPDRRAAGRIAEAMNYARAAGVTDAVAVDGKRHVMATNSLFTRPLEHAYQELYRSFISRAPEQIPETDILSFMEERDRDKAEPIFGFDTRDRHRILRILSQSHMITWRDELVSITQSRWGEAGSALSK